MKAFTQLAISDYLQALSSAEPIPGGGSVSAYVASLAMGLTQMVGGISLKRKRKEGLSADVAAQEEERREKIQKVITSVEELKQAALQVVDLDPVAFEEVNRSYGQPEKMEEALWKAFKMQADLAALILKAAALNDALMTLVSGSIKNDLLVSRSLSRAAFEGAYDTAHINVVYMKQPEAKLKAEHMLADYQAEFSKGLRHASV